MKLKRYSLILRRWSPLLVLAVALAALAGWFFIAEAVPGVEREVVTLAVALGVLVWGLAGIFGIEFLIDNIKTVEDVRGVTAVPLLAAIDVDLGLASRDPFALMETGAASEFSNIYRSITPVVLRGRGGAGEAGRCPSRKILVCSPQVTPHTSIVAANLAAASSQWGCSTLLIDADRAEGDLSKALNLAGHPGFVEALAYPGSDIMLHLVPNVPNLHVLPAGAQPFSEPLTFTAGRLVELIDRSGAEGSVVVVAGPPMGAPAGRFGAKLARAVDDVVLLAVADDTKRRALRRTVESLRQVGANIAGVVYVQRASSRRRQARPRSAPPIEQARPQPVAFAAAAAAAAEDLYNPAVAFAEASHSEPPRPGSRPPVPDIPIESDMETGPPGPVEPAEARQDGPEDGLTTQEASARPVDLSEFDVIGMEDEPAPDDSRHYLDMDMAELSELDSLGGELAREVRPRGPAPGRQPPALLSGRPMPEDGHEEAPPRMEDAAPARPAVNEPYTVESPIELDYDYDGPPTVVQPDEPDYEPPPRRPSYESVAAAAASRQDPPVIEIKIPRPLPEELEEEEEHVSPAREERPTYTETRKPEFRTIPVEYTEDDLAAYDTEEDEDGLGRRLRNGLAVVALAGAGLVRAVIPRRSERTAPRSRRPGATAGTAASSSVQPAEVIPRSAPADEGVIDAWLEAAEKARRRGNYREARALIDRVLDRDPHNDDAWELRLSLSEVEPIWTGSGSAAESPRRLPMLLLVVAVLLGLAGVVVGGFYAWPRLSTALSGTAAATATAGTQASAPTPTREALPTVVRPTVAVPTAAVSQGGLSRVFPQTGYEVVGPFLKFWESNGGAPIFGYPISDRMTEPDAEGQQVTVQYFERARFELHPGESSTEFEVTLGKLGADMPPNGSPAYPLPEGLRGEQVTFEQTGITTPSKFHDFWQRNGGERIFGYPVTPVLIVTDTDGAPLPVQYFERARFEYHPDRDDVQLTRLGTQVYNAKYGSR